MNLFKQTTLIGIGLIGSSIARALKEKRLSKKICIFSRTKKTINKAKKLLNWSPIWTFEKGIKDIFSYD